MDQDKIEAQAKELDEKAGAAIDARSVPAENPAVTDALAGKPSVRPSVVVSWGGIGAGKSSAAEPGLAADRGVVKAKPRRYSGRVAEQRSLQQYRQWGVVPRPDCYRH